jgi:microcystin-dependent protein
MSTPYVGQITLFGGNFAPQNYAMCAGQTIPITQNEALFALIGTTYGGDGQTTYQLPDLRGRVPLHQGTASSGTTYVIGQVLGAESVTLTGPQIPAHTHTAQVSPNGTTDSPVGAFSATDPAGNVAQFFTGAANAQMNSAAIAGAGGGQPHNNIQPVLAVTFIIAMFGIFPSQN